MTTRLLAPGEHWTGEKEPRRVKLADFSLECLKVFGHELYRRGDIVGRVKGARFEALSPAAMRALIDRSCHLERWKKPRGDGGVPRGTFETCDLDLAGAVLQAAREHRLIAELEAVVPHPLVTRSGEVLVSSRPRFEASDAYVMDLQRGSAWFPKERVIVSTPNLDVEPLPVWDLVADFPMDEASRANFLSLLLTALFRPLLGGNVPLFVITAPVERVGKSKLVEDVIGGLLFGGAFPTMQWPDEEEEIDKRILSMLLAGYTMACIDNVPGKLDSAALASLITSELITGRILGQSTMVTIRNLITLIATGNHVECSGEIARRAVVIELIPTDENPEMRTGWRHPDLKEAVAAVRPRVLRWLVDLVQDWVKAGQPPMSRPFGGFERWAATVGGVVEHAGYPVLVDRSARILDMDEDGADLRTLVAEWFGKHAHESVRAADLLPLAEHLGIWPNLLARSKAPLVSFGKKLGFYVGRRIGDLKIEKRGVGSSRSYRLSACADGIVL